MLQKYTTETVNKHGDKYRWSLWAESWKDAEEIAERRGIGEKVTGYVPNECKDCEIEGELI